MNLKIKALLPLFFTTLVAGCANTTIYPEGDNKFSLVATSSDQAYAEKAALKKATDQCVKQGKQLQVIKHEAVYQGMDKNAQAMLGVANHLLTGDLGNPAKGDDDWKVTLKFICK